MVQNVAVGLIESEQIAESERDHALPQDVLHRLTESQIGPEGERGYELREANARSVCRSIHRL